MSIRAGQILHVMNRFLVDRIQTGGPGNLNIPTERIFELGNRQTVANIRDVPDLTFTLDVLSVDTEVEAGLLARTAQTDSDGQVYDLGASVPVDIVSPWKSQLASFDAVRGVAIPHLTLESASYRYGLRDNAGETFSLRGDSIYYVPGTVTIMEFLGDGVETDFDFEYDSVANADPAETVAAIKYVEQGEDLFALSVSVDGRRLVPGVDYTEDLNGVSLEDAPANGARVRIVFGFDPATLTANEDLYPQTVHEGTSVKPAAIRGKDIRVYIGDDRWGEVQSTNLDWSVTLDDDFEFGNPRAISRDFIDLPAVTGTIELKPFSVDSFFAKINQITGVPADEVVGPQSSVLLPVRIELLNPDSGGSTADPPGTVLKTLRVPDARFTVPGYEGRVQQKYVTTLNYESDGGLLEVIKGAYVPPP